MDYISSLRLPFCSVTLHLAGADILDLGTSILQIVPMDGNGISLVILGMQWI